MMDAAVLSNVFAWSTQVAVLTAVAALLPRLFRVDAPVVRHFWWRAVLLACLLLPVVQPWQAVPTMPIEAPHFDLTPALRESAAASGAVPPASLLPRVRASVWPAALGVILVAGGILRLGWLVLGLVRLRRLRAAGHRAEATDGHRELTALTEAGAEIRYVPVIGQPVTFGIRHPVVLLPESLKALPDPIQRAVLAHELWHVRRRDWLCIMGEETVRAVFWFHPAIWYLVSRVQSSREEVVDELTVLLTNARRTYIEALLAFADEPPLFPATPFARRRHLFQRMLLISREAVMSSRRIVASSAAMAVVVLLTGWYGVAAFPLTGPAAPTTAAQGAPQEMQLKLHEPITMQFRNSSLTDVLTFIGRQSGIKFAYEADFANTTVTISLPRTSVLVALEQLLGSVGYTYEVAGPDMLLITRPRNQSTSGDRRGGGQQMPPRDFKPGEPGPPLNREVELQKALAADPGSPSTLYLELAKLQERRGAIADAESTLLAARQAQPTETRVLTTLAGFYTRTNRFDRAIAVVEDAAAADPSNPGLHQMVATYYWEKAFKDQSLTPTEKATYIQAGIAATDRALTYEPDHVEALTYKNILLRMQANMETDRARQAELIALADTLRNRAMELNEARRLSGGGTDVRAPGAPPPPPPPPPPAQDPIVIDGQTAVRIGGSIGPPKKLKDVRPVYPDEAQESRVQGVVIVEAVVDALGSVRETKVLRSIPMLDQAAVDAVQQWEFQPTLLNGVPVPVVMTVTVNFTLQ